LEKSDGSEKYKTVLEIFLLYMFMQVFHLYSTSIEIISEDLS